MKKILLAVLLLASWPCVAQQATIISSGAPQVATSAAWTPSDTSGASLTLTVNTAKYSQVGNMVFAQFSVTYPSTGSASSASIGGLPVNNASATNVPCGISFSSVATANLTYAAVNNGTKNIIFFTAAGAAQTTNAQLTGATIEMQCIYPAS